MSDAKEQVLSFLDYCEEMKTCKFIMATTKIKGLLKCIANSSELYRLFESVTKDFNYPECKEKCLVRDNRGLVPRSSLILPQTVGNRLAFIFCLLVEFDSNTLSFNDFLMEFYPEDGSYYTSYRAFCNTVIAGLEDAITQVFKDVLQAPNSETQTAKGTQKSQLASVLKIAVAEEIQYITDCKISEEDKKGGIKILEQLIVAVKTEDEKMIDALVCGYNYFLLYNKCVSTSVGILIQSLVDYEKLL